MEFKKGNFYKCTKWLGDYFTVGHVYYCDKEGYLVKNQGDSHIPSGGKWEPYQVSKGDTAVRLKANKPSVYPGQITMIKSVNINTKDIHTTFKPLSMWNFGQFKVIPSSCNVRDIIKKDTLLRVNIKPRNHVIHLK